MEIKTYKQNEIIFKEGALEPWMFSIAKGSVGIYVNYGDAEKQKLLTELKAGQRFGEMGLFENQPRSAGAVALEDGTELELIDLENACQYFSSKPEMLLNIMRAMSGRIRSLTDDYMDACRTIAEAAETAKKGAEKTSGLKARLAKIVNDYIKPCFLSPAVNYDMDAYMVIRSKEAPNTRVMSANTEIFREGAAANCAYYIRRGIVGIYADFGKPSQKLLVELKEDNFFGEMGIIDDAPRSASAIALSDNTELEIITAENFAAYLQEKPMKALAILQHMSRRLRALTDDYMEACRSVSRGVEAEEKEHSQLSWLSPSFEKYITEYNRIMDHSPFYFNY